jgi:DNA damage-binding protein 1
MCNQASVQLQGIKGLWSLKSSLNDQYDTFLVVTFINETRFLAMNKENELEETDIEGFDSETQTLVCGSAIHNQLIQVLLFPTICQFCSLHLATCF